MRTPTMMFMAAAIISVTAQMVSAETKGAREIAPNLGGHTVPPARGPAPAVPLPSSRSAQAMCAGLTQAQCLQQLAERSDAMSRRLREVTSTQPQKKLTPGERAQHDRQLLELSTKFAEIGRKARERLSQFDSRPPAASGPLSRDIRVDPRSKAPGNVSGGVASSPGIRQRFDDKSKDLESQDKLGNFEIQDLMSQYNNAEERASSFLKKTDDAKSGIMKKIF